MIATLLGGPCDGVEFDDDGVCTVTYSGNDLSQRINMYVRGEDGRFKFSQGFWPWEIDEATVAKIEAKKTFVP